MISIPPVLLRDTAQPAQPPVHQLPHGHALGRCAHGVRLAGWILRRGARTPRRASGIYVHMPFCQSLCTFCGCNMRLARNHALAAPYVGTLLREFALYRAGTGCTVADSSASCISAAARPPGCRPSGLDRLLDGLPATLQRMRADADLAIEVDPRNTTREQLTDAAAPWLQPAEHRRAGLRRARAGNRQPRADRSRRCAASSRMRAELGFQQPLLRPDLRPAAADRRTSLRTTFDIVEQLRPDRISFLPYAHVPWIKHSQRRYTEADLPESTTRQQLYVLGRERMGAAGFVEIGLDQYAAAGMIRWRRHWPVAH